MSGLRKTESRTGTKTGTRPLCSAKTYRSLFVSSALLSFGDFLARGTLFAKIFPSVQTSVVDGEGVQTSDRPPSVPQSKTPEEYKSAESISMESLPHDNLEAPPLS
jgi:hypothetical protein